MTAALEGGEWSAARPGRTLPPGKTRYPFYRMLGGPQGRSGRAENLVPTGIRSRTVQPVASRYTDRATRPTNMYVHKCIKLDTMYVATMTIYWSNVVKQAIHKHNLHWSHKHTYTNLGQSRKQTIIIIIIIIIISTEWVFINVQA